MVFDFFICGAAYTERVPALAKNIADVCSKNPEIKFQAWMFMDETTDNFDCVAATQSNENLSIRIQGSEQGRGKCYWFWKYITNKEKGDYVGILDGDDQLYPQHFYNIPQEIEKGFEVGWTMHERSSGKPCFNLPIPSNLPPRSVPWLSSHFFWFKTDIYKFHKSDLMLNGAFINEACDVAIALPVIETTSKRSFLQVALYKYNDDLATNIHANMSRRSKQRRNKEKIYAKKDSLIPRIDCDFMQKNLSRFQAEELLFYSEAIRRSKIEKNND